MTINEIPILTMTDVTGVVDATAAAEIAALGVLILSLIPVTEHPTAQDTAQSGGVAPEYDRWPPSLADNMIAEIDAFLAAVAAAPTS